MNAPRSSADALMARAAAGEREAFAELADTVGRTVHRFCLAQLPPHRRDEADDARQECFLRAWKHRRRFRPGGDALAWLLGIAMNVIRERRRRHRRVVPLEAAAPVAVGAEPEGESLERLGAALEALPQRQREAIICRFLRGMSVARTAAAMGCAEGTVKANVFKGVANLRRMMRQRNEP